MTAPFPLVVVVTLVVFHFVVHAAVGIDSTSRPPSSYRTPVEIDDVYGCETNSFDSHHTAIRCPTNGSAVITIRGRGFGNSGAAVFLREKSTGVDVDCGAPVHSQEFPSLLLTCKTPTSESRKVYHVVVQRVDGNTGILRAAVTYGFESGDKSKSEEEEREAESDSDEISRTLLSDGESLGVGGLDKQMHELFRRAFASRFSALRTISKNLGIRHVKGVILHGPPGTGKTLLARKIAEGVLHSKNVQLISGPELLNKYVGESEKNVRDMFAQAEEDYDQMGDNAPLHIIIIDELDAIMQARGLNHESSTRVYDGITAQMLAVMDGLDSTPNVLLIGLTNQLQSIDKALLRPGRFEVQIRVPLPNETAREQIFRIHTKELRAHHYLAPSVNLTKLASTTAGWSGAEIEGCVHSATSFAMERVQLFSVESKDQKEKASLETVQDEVHGKLVGAPSLLVTEEDFERGFKEISAVKAASSNLWAYYRNGIVPYRKSVDESIRRLIDISQLIRGSTLLPLTRVSIEGPPESGVTAMAAFIASMTHFQHIRILTPANMVDKSPEARLLAISNAVSEAAEADTSCLVIDGLDVILDASGDAKPQPWLASSLKALLSQPLTPESHPDSRMLIVVTSNTEVDSLLGCSSCIDAHETIEALSREDMVELLMQYEVFSKESEATEIVGQLPPTIGIKRLLHIASAARAVAHIPAPLRPLERLDNQLAQPSASQPAPAAKGESPSAKYVSVQQFRSALDHYGWKPSEYPETPIPVFDVHA